MEAAPQSVDLDPITPRGAIQIIESDGSSSDSSVVDENKKSDTEKESKKDKTKIAKKAFESRDAALSMEIHMKETESKGTAKEKHKKGGDYLKSIIYGGLDGIMTSFSVVTAAAGGLGALGSPVILVLGISNLIADGIAMGIGDFISGKAENDHALAEREREEWEYENFPKGEIDEMIELYKKKGMKVEHAQELVAALIKHKDTFINTMMVEELGVMTPDPDDSPAKGGLVTFASFVFYGIFPLIPFMIGSATHADFWVLFAISCILMGFIMFGLGAVTSFFTILPWYRGGTYLFLVGAIAALASYGVGFGLGEVVPSGTANSMCNCTYHNASHT